MAEDPKDSNVKSTIEAVTGLVKAVPIYEDAIQPAAKQIGKSLETVTKVVNIVLVPLHGLVWGYERIEHWLSQRLAQKLNNIPPENIVTPPIEIAGPTIEALRYTSNDSPVRELYANLLATAMNKETINQAHPGYVEVLKNLSKDEAILLKSFVSQQAHPIIDIRAEGSDGGYTVVSANFTSFHHNVLIIAELIPLYLDNLCRLGLLEKVTNVTLKPDAYEPLESDTLLDNARHNILESKNKIKYARGVIHTTTFGTQFIKNIVQDLPSSEDHVNN